MSSNHDTESWERTDSVPRPLVDGVRGDGIVVMAGAGVSAVPPSSLPGWYDLNAWIVDALRDRIEAYLGRSGYLAPIVEAVAARRTADRFPPDYQAQILEENCGAVYFEALQALEVDACNGVHARLARMAKHGSLRAVVTTNFDRLVERALDGEGVPYHVAYEPDSYARCEAGLTTMAERGRVQVVKVHGCVREPLSMIDTLKQRLLGRNQALNRCLALLLERYHWLFLGFSASDLESDDGYLELIPGATRSPGITYVQWSGEQDLSPGARKLLSAYAGRATHAVDELESFLDELAERAGMAPGGPSIPDPAVSTRRQVVASLARWAGALHPATVVTCLAAICESNGETLPAFQLLDRFWKDVVSEDRDGEAFERYRTLHGRLGAAGGLISLVDDLQTDRGMESIQNLLRTLEGDPRSSAWAGLAWTWAGRLDLALPLLDQGGRALEGGTCGAEEYVDIWLASAEAIFTIHEPEGAFETWPAAFERARESGDLARMARVAALMALFHAEFLEGEYPEFSTRHAGPVLSRAQRLHDPAILGLERLARGRFLTRLRDTAETVGVLQEANLLLRSAGRSAWQIYAGIQLSKALLDARRMDEAADVLNEVDRHVDRYQVWLAPFFEAKGQGYLMVGQLSEARRAFEQAIEYAGRMDLNRKAASLHAYLEGIPVKEG
jgi:tetratricopeptide (TPR) repeat protein